MKKVFQRILLTCIVSFFSCFTLHGISTLSEATDLAKNLVEFPQVENQDPFNPRYTLYNKKRTEQEQSFIYRLLNLLGFKKNTSMNRAHFVDLLQKVSAQRSCAKKQGEFIQKITASEGAQFILFSNLHGAFHSFVRDLNHLKEWGVLDDNFVIQKEQCYIIINGNAIDRSAYNLETLFLILKLLEANPEKVQYVQGHHEFGRWVDYDLKTELRIRMSSYSSEDIPLKKTIEQFFSSLPLSLYVKYGSGSEEQFISFSPLKGSGTVLDKDSAADFLLQDYEGTSDIYYLTSKEIKNREIALIALFKNEKAGNELFYDRGLSLMIPDGLTANWDLFSAPTSAYQEAIHLYSDSFAVIDAQADMKSWTLIHYTQDVHKKEPLVAKVYDVQTGSKLYSTEFSFNKKSSLLTTKSIFSLSNNAAVLPSFYIGATMDLSIFRQLGHELFEGFSLRINQENKRGGVNKKLLKFFALNDHYSVLQAEKNTKNLLQQGIDTQVMLFGSQSFSNIRPLIEEKKIALLFPEAGIASARDGSLTNLVHFMASYDDQVPVLIDHALDTLKSRSVAILYQDDAFGNGCLSIAKKLFEEKGFTKYLAVPYKRTTTDIKNVAEEISVFNPDSIMFFAAPSATMSLINEIGVAKISKLHLMSVHVLGTPEFKEFLAHKGLAFDFTQVVPNPFDRNLPIVAAYQNDMKEQGYKKISSFSLLGYIHATLLIEVLKKITGEISKEKIIAGFEALKNFDLGGILLNFDPETRSLGHHVWMVSNDKWLHKGISKGS